MTELRVRWRHIAQVVKTHAKQGGVIVVPDFNLPALLKPGMRVALVPPPLKGPRYFKVESADTSSNLYGQRVFFEGVSDISFASTLVGRTLLAQKEDLPDDFDTWFLETEIKD